MNQRSESRKREQIIATARALFAHYGRDNQGDLEMRANIENMRDAALAGLAVSESGQGTITLNESDCREMYRMLKAVFAPVSETDDIIERCALVCERQRTGHDHRDNKRADAELSVAAFAIRALKNAAPQAEAESAKADASAEPAVSAPRTETADSEAVKLLRECLEYSACGINGPYKTRVREFLSKNAAPQDAGRPHGIEGFGDSGLTGSGPVVAAPRTETEEPRK